MPDARRSLPAVGTLLDREDVRALGAGVPHALLAEAVRHAIDDVRSGRLPPPGEAEGDGWRERVGRALGALQRPSLRPVLNATGVVLHTNLGRAPLAAAALEAITRTAGGACNLEYDLDAGARGSRYVHCVSLLCELTGAEDAIVVNNCAAALVLALNTLADGCEAIVSRGELVEIGGSFRVPDIMARSGATLREVGTTNRTHLRDYADAAGERTGVLVKVHRSNFAVSGFVAEASLRELAELARARGVPLLFDFGSGLLADLAPYGLHGEPTARDAVRDGATLTLMSGDKLLGGPQAGILVGRRDVIEACRRNPLCRALRVDKLTLAALEATLVQYREPEVAVRVLPALAMLTAPPGTVRARAESLGESLRTAGVACEVAECEATVGGGAFPTARIPSSAIVLGGPAAAMDRALRAGDPAVVGRIERDRLWLDLRSLVPSQDVALQAAVMAAASATVSAAARAADSRGAPGAIAMTDGAR